MALAVDTRQQERDPEIKFIPCTSWEQGLYTRRDADRTPIKGLRVTENVKLNQNGTVMPRPGLKLYGVQPTGTVIGQVYEFVRMNTSVTPNIPETYNIWFEDRGGTGYVVLSKDGGAHTVATGRTFTVTNARPHFEQVFGKVIINTGVDTVCWMDVQTFAITVLTALTQPSGVSAVASGVGGSTYTLRYRVAAANQGETAASSAQTVGLTKLRDIWNGTSEYVTFTWNRVSGAQRYNIYVGDQAGFEYYLDTVVDAGSGATQSYVDTGSIAETTTRIAPVADSTAGMKTTRAKNIKGQPYMVGDTENPGRIWFGGTGSSALDFSSFNGGGWVEPNKGGKDFPVVVMPFRDGKGTPMAVCLSKGTNGAGKRYLLQPSTTTIGSTLITYMAVQEDNGEDGTDSPDGVVFLNDALWFPSRNGFKTSNTRANIQNIISTQGITDNIGVDVANLTSKYMENCVGLAHDQCIYWALPYSSTSNNQIWVLDLRQKGAWMRPWNIEADWLWLYADNTDYKTKFMALVNNKFYEIDPNTATNDNGVSFPTNIASGDIKADENSGLWMSVIDVTFVFLRAQGNINLSVNPSTEDGVVPYTDTMPASSSQMVGGWGAYGWSMAGWGNLMPQIGQLAVASTEPRRQWVVEIDEECRSLSWGVNTTESGVNYELAEVIIRYVPVGYKEIDNA